MKPLLRGVFLKWHCFVRWIDRGRRKVSLWQMMVQCRCRLVWIWRGRCGCAYDVSPGPFSAYCCVGIMYQFMSFSHCVDNRRLTISLSPHCPPLFVRVDSQRGAGSSREFYKRHEGEILVYNILVAGRNLSGMRASLSLLFASGMTCCSGSGCCCFGICSCA